MDLPLTNLIANTNKDSNLTNQKITQKDSHYIMNKKTSESTNTDNTSKKIEPLSKLDSFVYDVVGHIVCAAIVIGFLVLLSGCSSHRLEKNAVIDELPHVDTSKPESFLTRFKPAGMKLGGWLEFQESGSFFKPVTRQRDDSALIYFYRTNSNWSKQEIVAANIFLNGKHIDSLKNNHYYPIELPAGTYRLAIRRPLPTPPTSFQKGTVVDFSVSAGNTYYLKYAEQYHVVPPKKELGLLYMRPLIQMPESEALKEIGSTRLKTQGYIFNDNPNVTTNQLAHIFDTKLSDVADNRLTEQKDTDVNVQFKIYNPLTW